MNKLGIPAEFACDSFKWYWNRIGQQCYRDADSILMLVDCGGSNSAAKYIFKHDLQSVVNAIGVEVRVAHYPSYCSKYNIIERRLFPHVSRACTGMLFDTLERVVGLMRKATTSTGLETTVNVIKRIYETGRKATDAMKETIRATVQFHELLPKWNYTITPQIGQ
jgi:predicted amino acid-binding ACT domain protein